MVNQSAHFAGPHKLSRMYDGHLLAYSKYTTLFNLVQTLVQLGKGKRINIKTAPVCNNSADGLQESTPQSWSTPWCGVHKRETQTKCMTCELKWVFKKSKTMLKEIYYNSGVPSPTKLRIWRPAGTRCTSIWRMTKCNIYDETQIQWLKCDFYT